MAIFEINASFFLETYFFLLVIISPDTRGKSQVKGQNYSTEGNE